jgi:hypothetical protein
MEDQISSDLDDSSNEYQLQEKNVLINLLGILKKIESVVSSLDSIRSEFKRFPTIESFLTSPNINPVNVPVPKHSDYVQNKKRKQWRCTPEMKKQIRQSILIEGKAYEDVCEEYNVSHSTAYRHANYDKKMSKKEALIYRSILEDRHLVFILENIEDDPNCNQTSLFWRLKSHFGLISHEVAIKKAVDCIDINFKCDLNIPEDWNTPEIIQQRLNYFKKLTRFGFKKQKVYVGEFWFNLCEKNSKIISEDGRVLYI